MNRTFFEVFSGSNSQYYFRYKAANGEQILASEGYTTKQSCIVGIDSVKRISPYDSSYRRTDAYLNYRFTMVAGNGETVAKSSEGYVSAQGRENAISVVKVNAAGAEVRDLTASRIHG
ncbi:YegP family protein [Dyadobacter tibetensis]|uniref:YegP family protein n=1 Tax=Dyadobacter tibetensis TaxID=1211851 RepID=UPI000470BE17|nr:YegP family protein [Dyadobacter tibetensis]